MQPQQPVYGAPAPPPIQPDYDFIINPEQPGRRRPSLGGGSMLSRILIVGVGLIILITAFSIIKGVLGGGGNKAAMLHVAQDQQEIIHLTTPAIQIPNISTANKDFAVSANLVVTSQQSQLVTYLQKQHQKIPLSQLNLKVSPTLDTSLKMAAASSTYDQTFKDIMNSQLTDYESALKLAYSQTTGPIGRTLIKEAYNSATLLQQQLTALD